MSTWIKVKPEDIDVNLEDGTVEVLYSTNDNGNNYIEISLEDLQLVLDKEVIDHLNQESKDNG